MSRGKHVAIRMCMGCGKRTPQAEMARVALTQEARLTAVSAPAHHGRSGYLHRAPACWDQFASRKGPLRSLGRAVSKETRAAFVLDLKHSSESGMPKE